MKKWAIGLVVALLAVMIGYGQRAMIAEKLVAAALPRQMEIGRAHV